MVVGLPGPGYGRASIRSRATSAHLRVSDSTFTSFTTRPWRIDSRTHALYAGWIRAFPGAPVLTAAALSSVPVGGVGLAMGASWSVSGQDAAWMTAFGLSFALAVVLFTEGARRIPAAETGLYGGLEVPFAVGLAWLVLGEAPPVLTLAGGALVMGAVLWRGAADLRS